MANLSRRKKARRHRRGNGPRGPFWSRTGSDIGLRLGPGTPSPLPLAQMRRTRCIHHYTMNCYSYKTKPAAAAGSAGDHSPGPQAKNAPPPSWQSGSEAQLVLVGGWSWRLSQSGSGGGDAQRSRSSAPGLGWATPRQRLQQQRVVERKGAEKTVSLCPHRP